MSVVDTSRLSGSSSVSVVALLPVSIQIELITDVDRLSPRVGVLPKPLPRPSCPDL